MKELSCFRFSHHSHSLCKPLPPGSPSTQPTGVESPGPLSSQCKS